MKKLLSERFSTFLIILGILIIIGSIIVFKHHHSIDTHATVDGALLDQMGSFLAGAVGSLWALAGVILFYVALREQREDIKINKKTLALEVKALEEQAKALQMQSEELELTREELKAQRIEFEKQNDTLTKQHENLTFQQFENTFFNLLKMFNELKQNTQYRKNQNNNHEGISYFIMCSNFLKHSYNNIYFNTNQAKKNNEVLELCKKYNINNLLELQNNATKSKAAYVYFSKREEVSLDHYFRTLYRILNFLNYHENLNLSILMQPNTNTTISQDRPTNILETRIRRKYKVYTDIIQSQLSSAELLLLFYNALFYPKMREMIYHYDLIENLNKEDLLDPENDLSFYNGETFSGITYNAIKLKSRKEILKP